jgi:hypothetical protein
MSEVCARDFRRFPVGRLIGSTKIRYEWEVVVAGELLCFVVLHSKLSKSFRLFLNEVRLIERVDATNDISLLIIVDRNSFSFAKKSDDVCLSVNSKAFDQLTALASLVKRREFSTWEAKKSKRLVEFHSTEQSLYNTVDLTGPRNFGQFTFEWKDDVCSVKRGGAFTPVSVLPDSDFSPVSPGANVVVSEPVYKFLNDSGDVYMHEFLYLFTQEVTEDRELVRAINGLMSIPSSQPPLDGPPPKLEVSSDSLN